MVIPGLLAVILAYMSHVLTSDSLYSDIDRLTMLYLVYGLPSN